MKNLAPASEPASEPVPVPVSVSVSASVPVPTPSRYKVSTITAVASVSTCIDLDLFFEHLVIGRIDEHELEEADTTTLNKGREGTILFAGKGSHANVRTRGVKPVSSKRKTTTTGCRFFDHQVTVVYRTPLGPDLKHEIHNIKIFHNGNVQLTGVKSLEGGRLAVVHIAKMLTDIASLVPDILPLGLEKAPPIAANYRACLINSDFQAGYVLRRDRLYALLSSQPYGVQCVFETYYPGVKAQFMWNAEAPVGQQTGVCRCGVMCSGRGDGQSLNNCRKITMSVFQSGCCIITGAHTYAQLEDAYAFMTGIFVRHHALLARPCPPASLKVT